MCTYMNRINKIIHIYISVDLCATNPEQRYFDAIVAVVIRSPHCIVLVLWYMISLIGGLLNPEQSGESVFC